MPRKNDYVQVWPTGETELKNESILSFFPNPAFNSIHIKSNNAEPIQVKITDILGHTVISKRIANESDKEINIEHLPKGIYFIELVQGKHSGIDRLILR